MIKREHIYLGLGFMLLLIGCMKYGGDTLFPRQEFGQNEQVGHNENKKENGTGNEVVPPSEAIKKEDLAAKNITSDEINSLREFSSVLIDFALSAKTKEDLEAYLKQKGYEPVKSEPEVRPYFIRTNKNPPGIRYIHAQYFEDYGGGTYLQHMSFEFRLGPSALEVVGDVVSSVLKSYDLAKEGPAQDGNGLKEWKLPGGMHLYVMRLEREDLQHHPFNAYTPEDVGTIKIAIEEDIHGDEHEGHSH